MEEITLNEEMPADEIDGNNKSDASDILKYVSALFVLLVKIFAIMHINSNPSDNKSSVQKIVDILVEKIVDTFANKANDTPPLENFHALFYSHTGCIHIIIDVAIYIILAVLFVMVFHKLMCLLSTGGNPFYRRLYSRIKQLSLWIKWVLICAIILLICAVIFLCIFNIFSNR